MLISMYGILTGHKILANIMSDNVVCSINMSGYNMGMASSYILSSNYNQDTPRVMIGFLS